MSGDYYALRGGDNYSVKDAQAMARQMWPDKFGDDDDDGAVE